jgi:chromosome segregation protein
LLQQAEQTLATQQQAFEQTQRDASHSTTQVQLWQNKVQNLEQSLLRNQERQQRLKNEMATFATDGLLDDVAQQQEILAELDICLQDEQLALEQLSQQLTQAAQDSQSLQQRLHQFKSQQQQAQGQESALQALQQAAIGRDNQQQSRWLQQQNLAHKPRLAEVLHVEAGFESLVETVLGDALKAIVVDDISSLDFSQSPALIVLEKQALADGQETQLTTKLLSDIGQELVANVRYCDTLSSALAQRSQLVMGESLITRDGFWLGRYWLKVLGKSEDSVLARQQRLVALHEQLVQLQQDISSAQTQQIELNQQQQSMEQQRLQAQRQLSLHLQQRGAEQAKLAKLQAQLTQTQLQAQRLQHELEDLAEQSELDTETLAEARLNLEVHLEALQQQQLANEDLQTARESSRLALHDMRFALQQSQQQAHQLALKTQGVQSRLQALRHNSQRQQQQFTALSTQQNDIQLTINALLEPIAELKTVLEDFMAEKLMADTVLQEVELSLQQATQHYRQLEQQRHSLAVSIEPLRQKLEIQRLHWQNISVQQSHIVEQLKELNINQDIISNYLVEPLIELEWQTRLEQLATKIARLGAINLAAIDEYAQQAERKIYLDNQAQDLEDALEKLESAIKHIDKETALYLWIPLIR